jgi:Ca2+-binding EF-hand superfamily protein
MSASRLVFALTIVTLPWIVTTSAAQTGQDAGRFRGMDRNGDGRITRDEWRGSTQSFNVHDWNKDGVLAGDEVRPGSWPNSPWDETDFDPDDDAQVSNWTAQAFRNLDHNRDGRITQNEWHFDLETFRRVDRDSNNSISRAEYLGGDAGEDDDRNDQFEFLDHNTSGRVELDEWHGTRAAFNRLDRNRDGVLTRLEMTGAARPRPLADRFVSVDYNRNGVVSLDEWHWSPRSFDQRDLNRDGVLTRREFNATVSLTNDDVARASNESRDVRVDPREPWTPSGFYVRAGELVRWEAEGTIRMSSDNSDTATPAGSTSGRRASNAPIREALAGGLLMKLGDSVVRFVGPTGSFRASTAGELFLGVNDDHLPDNSGEYRVRVTVTR